GYSSGTSMQPGIAPAISQLVPDSTAAGGPGFVLTINGSQFASGAAVSLNGVRQSALRMTAKQLTTNIPSSAIVAPGMGQFTVTNPATSSGGGIYSQGAGAATSNTVTLTVQ